MNVDIAPTATAVLKKTMLLPKVVVITTGGTIAMKRDPLTGASMPAINGADLLAAVPGIAELAVIELDDVFNKPSDYFNTDDWLHLHQHIETALARDDISAVIIAHGTDTLEETAYFLDLTSASDKPVILVGAQRNASESDSDGPRNIRNALRVAIEPAARGKGAMVVVNHQISAARDVSKGHTTNVDGFQAGEMGFLGYVDDQRVTFYRPATRRQHIALTDDVLSGKTPLAQVDIVVMYAGAQAHLLNAAVANGARGIVVQGLGAGNVNQALFQAIKTALAKNIAIVIATRVPNGHVQALYGYEGGGKTLLTAGAVLAGDLSPQKARILLMLALQGSNTTEALQHYFF